MEFYHCACACLAESTFISPTAYTGSTRGGEKGWVDFVVNSNKWWLIEFVREGSNLQEHLSRFDIGGRYRPLMVKPNQIWAVVDFRISSPEFSHPNLFSVVHSQDFLSYAVYHNSITTPAFVHK